jgi:DNA-binding beta-propeller fold protein YncE
MYGRVSTPSGPDAVLACHCCTARPSRVLGVPGCAVTVREAAVWAGRVVTVLTLALVLGGSSANAAPRHGAVTQLPGKAGCVSSQQGDNCAPGRFLTDASAITVSNDGRNVYVATFSGFVAAFARDDTSGAIRQLPGRAGCLGGSFTGCATARGLGGGYDITLDPSERYVYVSGGSGISIFRRDVDGSLTQLPGELGCISYPDFGQRCASADGPRGDTSIAISPDGRHAYLTDYYANAIVSYNRDTDTGALLRVPGRDGCLASYDTTSSAQPDCQPTRGLGSARDSVFAADGRRLYVAGGVTSAVFSRDPATGRLEQLPGAAGCLSTPGFVGSLSGSECAETRGAPGYSVTVSASASNAYYSSGPDVTGFTVQGDGSLQQLAAGDGCITARQNTPGCAHGVGLGGQTGAIDVAPDDITVYVAASSFTLGGRDEDRAALTVFRRDALTGALTQLGGSSGCLSQGFEVGCGRARGIADAVDVAVSPDNRHVYAVGWASQAVAAFAICRPAVSPCRRLHVTNRGSPKLRLLDVPNGCVSGRFAVRVTASAPNGVRALGIRLDRRRLRRTTEGVSLRVAVPARRLSGGPHKLTVRVRDGAGIRIRRAVTFRRCSAS